MLATLPAQASTCSSRQRADLSCPIAPTECEPSTRRPVGLSTPEEWQSERTRVSRVQERLGRIGEEGGGTPRDMVELL